MPMLSMNPTNIEEKIENIMERSWEMGIEIEEINIETSDFRTLMQRINPNMPIPAIFSVFQYHTPYGLVRIKPNASVRSKGILGSDGTTGQTIKESNENKDKLKNLLKNE